MKSGPLATSQLLAAFSGGADKLLQKASKVMRRRRRRRRKGIGLGICTCISHQERGGTKRTRTECQHLGNLHIKPRRREKQEFSTQVWTSPKLTHSIDDSCDALLTA